jgi:flagellar motor switch protein FliM
MEKVLSQQEIDAMVLAARGGETDGRKAQGPTVVPWEARQAGQIGREQVQSISLLHETFARNLTHSLGAYLRVEFKAALVSAEHLTYREWLLRIPERAYVASCKVSPGELTGLMQLDGTLAFPLIDILMGGQGAGLPPERSTTAIEDQVLETVMAILCRELGAAWQALNLQFGFEQPQETEQLPYLLPAEEKMLSLSFELKLADHSGTLNLAVPAMISNALLRKISSDRTQPRSRATADSTGRLRQLLLDCPFTAEFSLRNAELSVGELCRITPGSLLVLPYPGARPGVLAIGGQETFQAALVRQGSLRAAQLLAPAAEPLDAKGKARK